MPFPVYCALDEMRPVELELGDFNWVDAGKVSCRAKQLTMLPYQGPRWYSRQATQWCLKRNIIIWDDI